MKKIVMLVVLVSVIALTFWLGSIPSMYKVTYSDGSMAFLYFADCRMEAGMVACSKNAFTFPVYYESGVTSMERLISDN